MIASLNLCQHPNTAIFLLCLHIVLSTYAYVSKSLSSDKDMTLIGLGHTLVKYDLILINYIFHNFISK